LGQIGQEFYYNNPNNDLEFFYLKFDRQEFYSLHDFLQNFKNAKDFFAALTNDGYSCINLKSSKGARMHS
jgi:hypothetical protein